MSTKGIACLAALVMTTASAQAPAPTPQPVPVPAPAPAPPAAPPSPAFDNPMTKRCSAITAEVAAYLQANPGQPARRAPVFSTTAGLLLVAGIDRPAKDLAQWYRTLPAVFDEVLKQCAEKPEATMQDVLPGALKVGRASTPPPAD